MEKVHRYFGVALLLLTLGALQVCSWHHENTTKEFWSALMGPVSISWFSVGGHWQKWSKKKQWTVLKWPSMSSDLNSTEDLWRDLKTATGRRHYSECRVCKKSGPEFQCRGAGNTGRCLISVILSKVCTTTC